MGQSRQKPERSVIRLLKTSEMGRFPARLAPPSHDLRTCILEHHVPYCSNLLGRFATVLMTKTVSMAICDTMIAENYGGFVNRGCKRQYLLLQPMITRKMA